MANEMKGKPSIDCSSSSTLSWKLQYELKEESNHSTFLLLELSMIQPNFENVFTTYISM